jgi:hypothetical protein
MRRSFPVSVLVLAACGPSVIRGDVTPPGAPPAVALPALGPPPPAPACLDRPVPILDGSGASSTVLTDGERLFRVSDTRDAIEVAWKWGGPVAVLARAPADTLVDELAVGDDHVYWSISAPTTDLGRCILGRTGAIYRVAIAGGEVETLVADAGTPRSLSIAGGRLFWLDEGFCPKDPHVDRPRWVERLDLATKTRVKIREDVALAALALEGDTVTVLTGGDAARMDADGGGYRVLGRLAAPSNLLVRNGRTFATINPDGGHAALVELTAGGAVKELTPIGSTPTVLADADTVYVSDQGTVWAVPMAGGTAEIVAYGAGLAGMDGDRLLVWSGASYRALYSVPRTQRAGEIAGTGLIGPTTFTSDGTTLYWGDRYGGLWALPLVGGAAKKLTDDDTGAEHRIALAGDRLVFTSDGMDHMGPGAVGWIPTTGGKVTWLGQDLPQPLSLAVEGADVIVGDGRGAITRYPLAGGASARLTPEGQGGAITTLAADAKRIYFSRWDDRRIYAVDRKGGAPASVGEPTDVAMALLVDGADLLVATRFDGLQRLAPNGGAARVVAAIMDVPVHLAMDATHVYWQTSQALERIPRAGGPKERVAPGGDAFAVTADSIYWSTYGLVHRSPRPAAGATTGAVQQARDDELGPLAVVGDTVYFTSRTDVTAVDLRTGALTGVAAPHRTPAWIAATDKTVYFLADERIWAIDLAALPKRRAEMLAAIPNAMRREQAFDTEFLEPLSPRKIDYAADLDLTGDAIVWTTGTEVMRMATRGGAVSTIASGLTGAELLAHDANRLYVTAKDGAGWAVYVVGAAGTAPAKLAAVAGQPRGLAVDAGGVVASTDTAVVRISARGETTVVAANQRGGGGVAVRGGTVYWMTRDGIMTSEGCGPHLLAGWPADAGILGGATLAVTADGVVFSDPSAGRLVSAR